MKHASGSDKTVFWLIGGVTIVALVLIGFVAVAEQNKAQGEGRVVQYQATESKRPRAGVAEVTKDFGAMNLRDERTAEFTIENTGTKPLTLFNVTSSCDCTFGQITIDGVKSPEFSMHEKSSWNGSVDPGKTATVSVLYRPRVMPVKRAVSRSVTVQTNDPDNPRLTFSVNAVVN